MEGLNVEISYNKLWHILIDKGIKKSELSAMCHMSNSTLSKLSKNQPIKRTVLDKICVELDCKIEDILDVVNNSTE